MKVITYPEIVKLDVAARVELPLGHFRVAVKGTAVAALVEVDAEGKPLQLRFTHLVSLISDLAILSPPVPFGGTCDAGLGRLIAHRKSYFNDRGRLEAVEIDFL